MFLACGLLLSNEIKDRLADLQRQLDREIRRQLKTTQAKRLEQLLFQFHVRRVDHGWALKVIGKDAKVHSPLETNQVRDEAVYTQAAIELRQNMGMLIELLPFPTHLPASATNLSRLCHAKLRRAALSAADNGVGNLRSKPVVWG